MGVSQPSASFSHRQFVTSRQVLPSLDSLLGILAGLPSSFFLYYMLPSTPLPVSILLLNLFSILHLNRFLLDISFP